MKQTYLWIMLFITALSYGQSAVITSYVDATCTGAKPRTVEIYVDGTVDFTGWKLIKQTNGAGFAPGSSSRSSIDLSSFGTITNSFAYVTNDKVGLTREFGIQDKTTDPTNGFGVVENGNINSNGDDAYQIINNNDVVVDRFGEDGVQASAGVAWRHEDTYVYRINGTPANAGSFNVAQFFIAEQNLLDGKGDCGGTDNSRALRTIVPFGSYSTMASTTPTIIVGSDVSGLDYFENNGPSAAQTFSVSASNLTSEISLSAATNFEISLQETTGYASMLTIPNTGGSVATTNVYVRLASGLNTNTYTGNVSVGANGATTKNVAVSGEVTADDPFITLGGSIDGLTYNAGSGPSAADAFGVSGMFLTADITIGVNNEFEVSLDQMGTYATSLTITPVAGIVDNTTVYVRLRAGESAGDYTGTITASSTNAQNQTLSTSGRVNAAATCAPLGSIIVTEVLPNPGATSDANGEYFELYNTTDNAIDIQSWIIKDQGSDEHTIAASVIVPARGYVLLARSSTDNGGLSPTYVYAGFILANGDDELIIECGGNSIDEVVYDSGSWPFSNGIAMELTRENLNSVANDDAANWRAATTAYGDGDLGTPGAANNATLSSVSAASTEFSMYPNPVTTGQLFIDAANSGSFDVEIYSTLGQRVISQQAVSNKVDISSLYTGMYIVKITQGEASQTRKLVVK